MPLAAIWAVVDAKLFVVGLQEHHAIGFGSGSIGFLFLA
jgi:hypothetical protein